MTSIQNLKTKLQPLHYPRKDISDIDNDEEHLNGLFTDSDQFSLSQPKPVNLIRKSLQSKKNLVASPQNFNTDECILSSDDENVFVDLPKTNDFNKTASGYVPQNTKETKEIKEMPLSVKKFNMGLSIQPTDQKLSKPILNHTFGPTHTPSNTKAIELSKEDTVVPERIEEEMASEMLGNMKRKNIKYEEEEEEYQDKENMGNISTNFPTGGYMSNKFPSGGYQSKPVIQQQQSRKRDTKTPDSGKSRENHQKSYSNTNIMSKRNDISVERRHKGGSQINLSRSQIKQLTDGYRGVSEYSSVIYGKKNNRMEIYRTVLQEIQNMFSESDTYRSVTSQPKGTDKVEVITFEVMKERLGKRFAEGLYEIFLRYSATTGTRRNTLTLGKLLNFIRDYELFEEDISRETVSLAFARRCPEKFADFAAFVDILYKLHKRSESYYREDVSSHDVSQMSNKNQVFQQYLQRNILDKQDIIASEEGNASRLNITETDSYGIDYNGLRALEDHDELLNKLFRSYWPWNTKYQGTTSDNRKGIVLLKQFREFCYDFGLIPTLCSLSEVLEFFKRFQTKEGFVDFKGFLLTLCFIANTGFSKGDLQYKFDTFSKRLSKLCSYLDETSQTAPERSLRI